MFSSSCIHVLLSDACIIWVQRSITLPSVRLMLSRRALVKQSRRTRSPLVRRSAASWSWLLQPRLRSACSGRPRTARSSLPLLQLRVKERWMASSWRLPRLFRVSIFAFTFLFFLSFSWVLSSFLFFIVSDAAGIEFDRRALEHGSALDDATAAVEDRCSTVVRSLAKAKEVLGRFYKELVPKGATLDDVDALAEALSAEAPSAYKRKQKGIGASVGLAMALEARAKLDLPQVTSRMPTTADGSEVAFTTYSARCKRYGPKMIDPLAEYALRQQGKPRRGNPALRLLRVPRLRHCSCR